MVIGFVIAGYYSKQKYDRLLESTSQGLALGKKFGMSVDQSACMFGLKLGYSSCETVECELSANGYIAGCLKTAKTDGVCNGLPKSEEITRAKEWVSTTCLKNNLGTGKCLRYMYKYISVCEEIEGNKSSLLKTLETSFKRELKAH